MKKFIALSIVGLIPLCFSANLKAQPSQQDLDQVELMKQFIGTWEAKQGNDTTYIWEIVPLEKGYEHVLSLQIEGEKYHYLKAIGGFTDDYKTCLWYNLRPDGTITRNLGKFVSDNRMEWERYDHYHNNLFRTYEMTFETPDILHEVITWRSDDGTWDDANVFELTYTRVKK